MVVKRSLDQHPPSDSLVHDALHQLISQPCCPPFDDNWNLTLTPLLQLHQKIGSVTRSLSLVKRRLHDVTNKFQSHFSNSVLLFSHRVQKYKPRINTDFRQKYNLCHVSITFPVIYIILYHKISINVSKCYKNVKIILFIIYSNVTRANFFFAGEPKNKQK